MIAVKSMTTRTADTSRAPNCPSSSFVDPAAGAAVSVTVTVGTGVGSGDGADEVSVDVGVVVALSLEVGSGSELGEGDASGVDGEGEGVTNQGKPPVSAEPFPDTHVTPTSTTPPARP